MALEKFCSVCPWWISWTQIWKKTWRGEGQGIGPVLSLGAAWLSISLSVNLKCTFVWMFSCYFQLQTGQLLVIFLCLRLCNCSYGHFGVGVEIVWIWGFVSLECSAYSSTCLVIGNSLPDGTVKISCGNQRKPWQCLRLICTLLSGFLPECPLQNSGSPGVKQWLLLSNLQCEQWVSSWNSSVRVSGFTYLMSFVMVTVRVQIYLISGVEDAAAELQLCCFILPDLGKTLLRNGGKLRQQGCSKLWEADLSWLWSATVKQSSVSWQFVYLFQIHNTSTQRA